MRSLLTSLGIGLAAALLSAPPAASEEKTEWTDLFGRDLKDWSRSGGGKSPWRLTAEQSVTCAPANETLTTSKEFADGTLKFEYRFRPTEQKTGHRASFSVRQTPATPGCKIALGEGCGTMTAVFQGSSDKPKTVEEKPATNPAREIGQWNAVKVQLVGRSVQVWINGRQIASFSECETQRGQLALETEGWEIEFRRVMWKESK